jgi:hypothetical protein
MAEDTRQTPGKSGEGGKAGGPAAKRGRSGSADPLVAELRALRATLDEVVEQFHVRVSGQLADVQRAVAASGPAANRAARPPAKARAHMLRLVRALKVKPHKGRTKDLGRLADLIEELLTQLPA